MVEFAVPSETDLNKLLLDKYTSDIRPGYVTVQDFLLPERYLDFEKSIQEFEVFDSDIWICGYPKTGTNWMAELVWLISHDLDYEGAKEMIFYRARSLDASFTIDYRKDPVYSNSEILKDSTSFCKAQDHPRTIKTHLPFSLLPEQITSGRKLPKIIYTCRNPMDVCVSYYYHAVNYEKFKGTLEEFCKLFLFDKVNFGSYPKHVLSFWEVRSKPNILFLRYEESKVNLDSTIHKIEKLFGKSLSSEETRRLKEHVSFESMKNNAATNKEMYHEVLEKSGQKLISPFMRSGQVGGYKSTMPEEFIPQFHYWMNKHFEGSGLDLLNV